ncbi:MULTISPECIES: hypothetical protein [Pseudoalteromonas]|uniref:hypothetical protein n=1 Tax=Pseudoalteromonas TaxID=53246 RepID=UPI000782DC61|nr:MULTISPECIES: hypothetical protein [Pseudoalteromonas]QWV06187.1 hypothetical protein KQ246_07220 [Pseudoalteromonas shioyasakiensis]TMO43420.1 hypothetical protein CWC25_12340 [Pseudoalteromonas sp. S4389]
MSDELMSFINEDTPPPWLHLVDKPIFTTELKWAEWPESKLREFRDLFCEHGEVRLDRIIYWDFIPTGANVHRLVMKPTRRFIEFCFAHRAEHRW